MHFACGERQTSLVPSRILSYEGCGRSSRKKNRSNIGARYCDLQKFCPSGGKGLFFFS